MYYIDLFSRPIHSDNKGFKLLTKMGWSEGQALGKDGGGSLEPVSRPSVYFCLSLELFCISHSYNKTFHHLHILLF